MEPTIKPTRALSKLKTDLLYYPWQVKGIRFGCERGSFANFDDMGLGKSIQALSVAAVFHDEGLVKRVLVVAPGGLVGNWAEEITNNTRFSFVELSGSVPDSAQKQIIDEGAHQVDIVIASYNMLVKWFEPLKAMGFELAIWDEAHQFKDRTTMRSKAVRRFDAPTWNIVLTGTPLLNQTPTELWPIFNKVDPDLFPNYWRFRNRYAVYGGYQGRQIVGTKNSKELHELLDAISIRRTKSELGLVDPIVTPIYLDLEPEQRRLYDQIKEEELLELPGEPTPLEIKNALDKFTRLIQVCGTTAAFEGYDDVSCKLDWAVDYIKEVVKQRGEAIVVFTRFRSVQDALHTRLITQGIDFRFIHGDVAQDQRAPIVKAWREDAARGLPQVMTATYGVGGVGLNMTAANEVIRLDRLFVPKLNDQAVDRVNRLGRDMSRGPVMVWDPVCRRTIEQRIEAINRTKRKIFSEIVEGKDLDPSWKEKLVRAVLSDEDTNNEGEAA